MIGEPREQERDAEEQNHDADARIVLPSANQVHAPRREPRETRPARSPALPAIAAYLADGRAAGRRL
jgi:hypothetical protein